MSTKHIPILALLAAGVLFGQAPLPSPIQGAGGGGGSGTVTGVVVAGTTRQITVAGTCTITTTGTCTVSLPVDLLLPLATAFNASTTAGASLVIPSGVAPTGGALVSGAFWNLSGALQFYNGATKTLAYTDSAMTGTWQTHSPADFQAALANYSAISGLTGYPSTFPPVTTGLALLAAANTFTAGMKQTISQSATTAGFNLGALSSDPSGLAEGDFWYNAGVLKIRQGAATKSVAFLDSNITGSASSLTALTGMPSQANATMVANVSGGSAAPTAVSIPASAHGLHTDANGTPGAATGHDPAAILVCAAATHSGTAETCATSPTFTPVAGDSIIFQPYQPNAGAYTLDVNSLGAKPVKKNGATALVANDVLASPFQVLLTYDGTNWEMQGQLGNAPASGVTSVFGRTSAVTAQSGDYTAAQVTNAADVTNSNNFAAGQLQTFLAPIAMKAGSTSSNHNIFINGGGAGVTGTDNVAIGNPLSLAELADGSLNLAIGPSLQHVQHGQTNIGIGEGMPDLSDPSYTDASYNVAIGSPAGSGISSGTENTFVGNSSAGSGGAPSVARYYAVGIGSGANAFNDWAVAVGYHAQANNSRSTALGPNVTCNVDSATCIRAGLQLGGTVAEPSCDATHRGLIWYIAGATKVADTFQGCTKDDADAYSWVSLVPFVQASDPTCAATADIGKIWFNTTTSTTVRNGCNNVSGTPTWVMF